MERVLGYLLQVLLLSGRGQYDRTNL